MCRSALLDRRASAPAVSQSEVVLGFIYHLTKSTGQAFDGCLGSAIAAAVGEGLRPAFALLRCKPLRWRQYNCDDAVEDCGGGPHAVSFPSAAGLEVMARMSWCISALISSSSFWAMAP